MHLQFYLIKIVRSIRKKAGLLLLKHFLPNDVLQDILEDDQIYPFDRNDKRVAKWRKRVISKGNM